MTTSPKPSAASKVASYFSKLSPVPAFPEYTGPHKVGTVDVEIPVSHLEAPIPAPDTAADIHTIQFRVFYPAVPGSNEKRIGWLPNPQRHHITSYTKFLGFSHGLAEVLSFIPQHLYYTTIPVHKNAKIGQTETENSQWPTMIFSHGLGGSRNSYSYIAGSLASHGMVVICPEHRDGSAVASFIRLPSEKNRTHASDKRARRSIPYKKIPHTVCPEVYEAREAQLRIRMWEMGLIHQAVLAMNKGEKLFNMNSSTPSLDQFAGKMQVEQPGSIVFGGHSFGAATTVQFLKSVYYADRPTVQQMENPLCRPKLDSTLRSQITERTPAMLLDMWCLPLLAPNSSALFNLPLPVYDEKPLAPGGNGLLAVESEAFFKWTEHLHAKARILSPNPMAKVVDSDMFTKLNGKPISRPNFFYVVGSAHLSQSDFGILFPWLTKKIFDVSEPERALRLNLRAQLQFLRVNGVPVAETAASDLVDGRGSDEEKGSDCLASDPAIFNQSGKDVVDCWNWIDTVGMGAASENENGGVAGEQLEKGEQEIKGEIDPVETGTPGTMQRKISSLSVMSQQSTLREVAA